jgi:hypothetical protein
MGPAASRRDLEALSPSAQGRHVDGRGSGSWTRHTRKTTCAECGRTTQENRHRHPVSEGFEVVRKWHSRDFEKVEGTALASTHCRTGAAVDVEKVEIVDSQSHSDGRAIPAKSLGYIWDKPEAKRPALGRGEGAGHCSPRPGSASSSSTVGRLPFYCAAASREACTRRRRWAS